MEGPGQDPESQEGHLHLQHTSTFALTVSKTDQTQCQLNVLPITNMDKVKNFVPRHIFIDVTPFHEKPLSLAGEKKII